jgi:hypothetical protein
VHLVLGHLQLARADVLVRVELDLLEADHLRRHVDLAVVAHRPPRRLGQEEVEDAHLGRDDRVRVVVDLGLAHVHAPLLVVVLLDEVRAALQDVDRLLVHHRGRAVVVDLGDDARLARHVLHHEVVGGHAAQADRVRRVALARPVEAPARAVQQALLLQELQDLGQVLAAEGLAGSSGSSNAAHFTWLTRICRLSG